VKTGWGALGTVGYGFRGPFRVELEGGYRHNEFDNTSPVPELNEWSVMANVLYDISLTDKLALSLGAGAGADHFNFEVPGFAFDEGDWSFAYQGIAGLSYELTDRLDVFANYRYFRVNQPDVSGPSSGPATRTFEFDDPVKHTATIGLRYHFGAPEAAPMVAPPPPPPPPAEPSAPPREFIVFFGHNKSNLTAEAQEVIRQAAAAAKQFGSATITVVGHADRSGTPKYNQGLSQRRATTVKGALVGEGIEAGKITTSAKGESDPLVQTDDGVREPQNRRVHINL
jgi:outer membrane protein OmpA-like peptidoglycan-associated protein